MDELLLDETMEFRTQLGQYFGSQTRTTMDFVDFLREQHIFDSDRRISKKNSVWRQARTHINGCVSIYGN